MLYRLGHLVKQGLLFSLWVFLAFKIHAASAAIVPHLYDAALTCQSQTTEERQHLFQQGLLQVLEKISGEGQIKHKPQVKQALAHVQDYVEQYTYQGNVLKVRYSTELLNQLMGEIGHSVWGQRRPNVVLWLAIQEQQKRRLIGSETDPTIQSLIAKLAEKKGLPLTLPIMDLEDVAAVSVSDVWGQFPSVLTQASNRYGSQIILVGRVVHETNASGESWEGNWQLLTPQETPAWQIKGSSLEAVLDQSFSSTLHYLMGRYGVKSPSVNSELQKPLLLAVQNIRSGGDFNKVETYLNSLSEVVSVDIHQIAGQIAVFAVTLQGEDARQQLEQHLSADHFLIPGVTEGEPLEADMVFRLEPFLNSPQPSLSTNALSAQDLVENSASLTEQIIEQESLEQEMLDAWPAIEEQDNISSSSND